MAPPRLWRKGAVRVAVWVLGAALAQTVLPVAWGADALRFDALFAVALALALRDESNRAMLGAFATGLVADALSCGHMGLNAGLNVVLARGVLFARGFLFAGAPGLFLGLAFVAAVLKGVAYGLMMDAAYGSVPWGLLVRPLLTRGLSVAVAAWLVAALMGNANGADGAKVPPAKERTA